MKTINEVSLLDILPPSIREDEKVIAIAKSLDVELQKLSAQTKLPLHLPRLNELPHEVLDELAWSFLIPYYEPETMSLDKKRYLISNAILDWRKIGTKYAVEKMLLNFSKTAKVIEWFDPDYKNPAPYHFKIKLMRLEDLADSGETILRLIDTVKNLRSHLDAFDFDLTRPPPDEILHVAFCHLLLGKMLYDLNSLLEEIHNLQYISGTNIGGDIFYNIASTNTRATQNLYIGFHQIQSGNIIYNTEVEVDDGLWYDLFLNWIKSKWRDWNAAKIIWYEPSEPIDDDDDEPIEDEFNGQYLKLWIQYHNTDKTRLIVMPFPRADLSGVDINSVPVDGIFIKRGNLSDKIFRASYVDKTVTKLYF